MKTSFILIPIMRDTLKNTALNMCFGLASLCSLVHFTPISTQQNQASKRAITTTLLFCLLLCVVQAQPWTQLPVTAPISTSSELGIHFVDDQIGYVVGTNGLISKTTTGGTIWTTQTSNTNRSLYSIYLIDALTGFAVGDGGVIKRTDDGGVLWQDATISNINPPPAGTDYRAVWFYNAYTGFIVGGISGSSGTILKTTNGGKNWDNISPTPNPNGGGQAFYGIFFTSAQDGYACDFDGRILKTNNGGTTWNLSYTSAGNHLNGIFFTSVSTGFAVGGQPSSNNGIVLKTIDAGLSWNPVTAIPSTRFYSDVKFFGQTGFINGGNPVNNLNSVIYKTSDGGASWSPETIISNTGARQFRLSLPCSHTGYSCGINGTILKIDGINEKICCDSFNNTFVNANFTYTNAGNVYTFTKPVGTISGDILSWDFGDGQTGTGSPVTHTYPSVSSSYLATLTITRPQSGGDTCKIKLCRLINISPCIPPTASITGNLTVCLGQSTTLTASGGGTYSWLPSGQTTASITVTPTILAHTYSVIVTDANGCKDTATLDVIVKPLPAFVLPNQTICQGQNAILTAAGGGTYLWSPNGQTTASITVTPAVSTTYSCTVTTNGCTGTGSAIVTVVPINISSQLTGYFPFNGNANDVSPSLINGTASNVTQTTASNGSPSAYSFNGTSSWIDGTTSSRGVTDKVSVCAWVKTTETQRGMWVAGQYLGGVQQPKGYLLSIGDVSNSVGSIGLASFSGRVDAGPYYAPVLSSTVKVNDGKWHCLVGTAGIGLNGTSEWKIYVDGILTGSVSGTATTVAPNTMPFTIGRHSDLVNISNPMWYNGSMDDVRVYNKVLTQCEVDSLCNTRILSSVAYVEDETQVNIFPNPNSDLFTLELSEPATRNMIYRVTDLLGQVILERTIETGSKQQKIQTTHLPNGIYFLQLLKDRKKVAEKKFVKQ